MQEIHTYMLTSIGVCTVNSCSRIEYLVLISLLRQAELEAVGRVHSPISTQTRLLLFTG